MLTNYSDLSHEELLAIALATLDEARRRRQEKIKSGWTELKFMEHLILSHLSEVGQVVDTIATSRTFTVYGYIISDHNSTVLALADIGVIERISSTHLKLLKRV